jgi:ribonuclease BN (tRNA processing enzyme)
VASPAISWPAVSSLAPTVVVSGRTDLSPQLSHFIEGVALLAARTKPELLIIYHRSNPGAAITLPNSERALMDEIRGAYKGKVIVGHDLDVF